MSSVTKGGGIPDSRVRAAIIFVALIVAIQLKLDPGDTDVIGCIS